MNIPRRKSKKELKKPVAISPTISTVEEEEEDDNFPRYFDDDYISSDSDASTRAVILPYKSNIKFVRLKI